MKANRCPFQLVFAIGSLGLLLASCAGTEAGAPNQEMIVEVPAVRLGEPIAGLTPSERTLFEQGMVAFRTAEDAEEGLGPVFNNTSCGSCHSSGALGGAAENRTEALVTRIGGIDGAGYSDLVALGGPVLQSRSIREFDASCPIAPEIVPAGAQYVSHRITTPLFGAGLIEAIPDSQILQRANSAQADGVRGRINVVLNPITGNYEIGRFGWKAQHSDLTVFSADAYLNEMGVTSDLFPSENLPQGQTIPDGWDAALEPEDQDGDVAAFADFMRFLAPPARTGVVNSEVLEGEKYFGLVGCANCHTPSMITGDSPHSALANKIVRLYSDLLLHNMGPGLADGIVQSSAKGSDFKTAPLWGLSSRKFLLHDGRATTIDEAILQHGGEAAIARDRYIALPKKNQEALQQFLGTL